MDELLEVLDKTTEFLYQQNYNQAYELLIGCLPYMATVIEEIEDVVLQGEITASLAEALTAMEEKDYTLLADILQYEIMDRFKMIGEE